MKKTKNDGGRENVEHDRISSLPDEVLSHMLSFLSTNEAVQTCVLSKRWKHTWAAVPILDINQKDFSVFWDDDCSAEDDDNVVYNEASRMSAARFERFMIGFLDHRAPTNLDRFCCIRHIHWLEPGSSIGWLDCVALLMPQLIDIVIFSSTLIDMPYLIFSCANLHHLSMSLNANGKTIIMPESINLPSLKFLELHGIELHNYFAEKLFMGCPSLERLKLSFCDLYFSGISSEVLKELTLDGTLYEHMQISCPNLVSLCMMIFLKGDGISLKNMSSLVNVYIELYRGDDVQNLNLLGSLSNVAKLELYLGTTLLKEQLEKDIPNCRNFNNLKKLVIGRWDMCSDFYLIACLLKHSPNLKELSLLLDENQCETQEPPRDVSGDILFWHEYLETVKIGDLYERVDKLSSKLINAVIMTLDLYVKKIGNLIIT